MDPVSVEQQIRGLIIPLLQSRQVELVELSCRYGGGRWLVRCLVDTARGITVQELSNLNRSIGAILDEHDVVTERYVLEVSSPGLDRPLKSAIDFERVIGRRIRVSTPMVVEGPREHQGELVGANEEAIVLKLDSGEKRRILLSYITHAVQEIEL